WPLEPGARPRWWPTATKSDTGLETGSGEVWSAVSDLWGQQLAGSAPWGADWVLAGADGRVRGGETPFDLSVLGFFQKPIDAGQPDIEEMIKWCALGDETVLRPTGCPPLRFTGKVRAVQGWGPEATFDGWGVAPAVGRFNV